jgi:hypothetical protein
MPSARLQAIEGKARHQWVALQTNRWGNFLARTGLSQRSRAGFVLAVLVVSLAACGTTRASGRADIRQFLPAAGRGARAGPGARAGRD